MLNMDKDTRKFEDIPLKLHEPKWDSSLASIIVELERLRVKRLGGPVPPYIFFQLKEIFHWLESLGSSRIEGNRTTLAEFVEKIIEKTSKDTREEQIREIFNIDRAIDFIEKNIQEGTKISRSHISEIHKIIVDGLTVPPQGEGSRYPGNLRPINVSIQKSNLVLPDMVKVPEYFDELLGFVNTVRDQKDDLLVTAMAHHRMTWIHPFDNGNGRMVRMFTYAMLIKQGFQVQTGRILNPTAIFCMNRDTYNEMLSKADTGEPEQILAWCEYVLSGLKDEIEKIDHLLNRKYTTEKVLIPALDFALDRKQITSREHDILQALVKAEEMNLRSVDLEKIIGRESSVQRSRIIKRLKDKGMLRPIPGKKRVYTIGFVNNYLLRGVIKSLEDNSFVPKSLNAK
ncbi:MAG: Filamentation induced by cAMP protein Fic [Microgenomates group bacterium GW2011_GWC1_43_11]|uniref:Filamentation induced by cAMP protein Fic n=2 Tax=Candidatus Gottesmaniibacteriota TaxID=1752720 RepID=A0A0G1LH98_9BACT|nr:MAG: Filamentation induced by cAMP protein Fic [Microgenomates group bacterium GW2011_GWC1_43_11]KKT35651.1 MAG: Filamentation induced by cAMP protein Fic [Candidatus Gottesmanbacteria bacterium GW2011_GWB1_44_11c]KKT59364.1 MAG: Filamentation induced by cAMP protein Fic [Candidatus Gottesmanbacteria bacterium GW2011_GWA1_44_24b]